MRPRSLARPALAALVALALLAAACGDGLGPEKLPEEIGSDERAEITETLEAFFDGVNRYDAHVASEVMLIPIQLGILEMTRMAWELGALHGNELRIEFEAVGPIEVVHDSLGAPSFVRVQARTSFGLREVELVRRDGNWRLSRVPDLRVPADAGTVHLVVHEGRSDTSAAGATVVVGEIENVGDVHAQVLNVGVIAEDAHGAAVATASAEFVEAVLYTGSKAAFRAVYSAPSGVAVERHRFVIVPKRMAASDLERFAAAKVSASDVERVSGPDGTVRVRGTLANNGFQSVLVFPAAAGYDASGRLLALAAGASSGHSLNPGEQQVVEIALPDIELLLLTEKLAEVRLVYLALEDQ